MNEKLTQAEQEEADFGEHVIWRLVGSKITAFGGNEKGEIFLSTEKGGQVSEFVIGKDENGEITLFEVENKVSI